MVVLTTRQSVASWARRGVELGPGSVWAPIVVDPSLLPVKPLREEVARLPELAVVAASMLRSYPADEALPALMEVPAGLADAADSGLADDAARLYLDAVLVAASEEVRRALEEAMEQRSYVFKSDFAQKYVTIGRNEGHEEGRQEGQKEGEKQGRQEGQKEGRQASILTIAAARGLELSDEQRNRILHCDDIAALERWLVTAATVGSAAEIFGEARGRS